jgi:hypothetical protein
VELDQRLTLLLDGYPRIDPLRLDAVAHLVQPCREALRRNLRAQVVSRSKRVDAQASSPAIPRLARWHLLP